MLRFTGSGRRVPGEHVMAQAGRLPSGHGWWEKEAQVSVYGGGRGSAVRARGLFCLVFNLPFFNTDYIFNGH